MNEAQALSKMVAPGQQRPGIWREGVLQIWVTRLCDKSCFGCTQGSNLSGKMRTMPLDQFEDAVKSLNGYFGVVGLFGGNPAVLKNFEDYCDILKRYVPFSQRGIWCNNPMGKASIMRECFNPDVSNLNVHLEQAAYDEFKRDWPESKPFGLHEDSRHSPVFVAMQDVIEDEAERWELIGNCDINRTWSALIGTFRGELRAWFCEIAGSQSMLHQDEPEYPDTGIAVVPDWWRRPMQDFAEQVRYHCHACGVPMRGYGSLAQVSDDQGTEFVSATHLSVYKPKRSKRQVELVTDRKQLAEQSLASMVDYIGNSQR